MNEIKEKIINELKDSILQITGVEIEPELMLSSVPEHGDFSTNASLIIAQKQGKSPREIGEVLKTHLEGKNIDIVEKIEVAGAGFINFYLSEKVLSLVLEHIQEQGDRFGFGRAFEGKKVMVEFTDPNPLKEFHIGHLYSNTVGESLSRLFEAQGAEVWRVCYQGDVGLHVAKAVYGIIQKLKSENLQIETLNTTKLEERAQFLGQAYSLGSKAFEEDKNVKQEIIDLNKKIYDKDPEIYSIYDTAKKWSLEYFDSLYTRLGTHFVRYYFESEAGTRGMMVVRENLNRVFRHDEGSIIFPKEISGLHTRVFVNSQGLPTYEAKELGLAPWKFDEFPYDVSVIITGNEINEYFKVLLKALSMIRPDLAEKTRHISHGMVRLPSGKMSSRTGDVVTGDSLLNEVRDRIFERMKDKSLGIESADIIGVGAVKYSLLRSGIGKDVTFDIEESINIEGNSGPYLQYTFVRTQSILKKSEETNANIKKTDTVQNVLLDNDEKNLVRYLAQFPQIVSNAFGNLAPSDMCTYLYKLSKEFNLFYEKNKIIGDQHEEIRLLITQSVGQVLKNGLYLLGIKTVERM